MNVVGDIAGQLKTLEALLAKMPEGELISLGDPNDRGPDSKGVIEYLMKNGRTVNSNHAHMLVDAWEQSAMPGAHPPYYGKSILFHNGGIATMNSYDPDWKTKINYKEVQVMWDLHIEYDFFKFHTLIPKEHIDFLKNCPMYIETEKFVCTHAPMDAKRTLEQASKIGNGFVNGMDYTSEYSLLWNRYVAERPNKNLNGKINLFGHNSSDMVKVYCKQYANGWKVDNETLQGYLKEYGTGDIWAICLDTSSAKVLTGLHTPTMTLYTQEYLD